MTDAFVGVDVAFAKRKPLAVVICTVRDGRVVPETLRRLDFEPPRGEGNAAILDHERVVRFAREAARYIQRACETLNLVPRRIAIDAPSAPRRQGARRRAAEAAMDAARISCFTTPTALEFEQILVKVRDHLATGGPQNRIPHANQLWMLVGFQLFIELARLAPCVEVFPQATIRALGSGQVHKLKAGGVDAQLAEAARRTGWPIGHPGDPSFTDIAPAPAHDRLDAYLSAWVAALDERDRVGHGDPPDDVIWAPVIKDTNGHAPVVVPPPAPDAPSRARTPTPLETADFARDCPACGAHRFTRWPLGWDAHAAHRCEGLTTEGPDARKFEFKQRFGHLFRQS